MALRFPPLDPRQREVLEGVLTGVRQGNFSGVRTALGTLTLEPKPVWLPPPLLTVVAGLTTLVVAASDGPWELGEDVWDKFLPDAQPSGRSAWRNANYALHAGACLAGGVWLDVGRQEDFWRLPFWPFAVDGVELLTVVAAARLAASANTLADQLVVLSAWPLSPTG